MAFSNIIPWIGIVVLFLIIMVLALLLGLKSTCEKCPTCEECEECEECDCDEEEPEEPTECKPLYPSNVKFDRKRIKINFYPGNYYLSVINDRTLIITQTPSANDYWTYDGNKIYYYGTKLALRYVNEFVGSDPDYANKFYNLSGFIQLWPEDDHTGEFWNYDGINFYYRAGYNDLFNYVLTPSIYYSASDIEYSSPLTIAPVSIYMNKRDMNNHQGVFVEL